MCGYAAGLGDTGTLDRHWDPRAEDETPNSARCKGGCQDPGSSHAKCNRRRGRRDTLGCNPTQRRFEEGRLGHKGKRDYFRAVNERYHKAERKAKQLMLKEFCLNIGNHRKYAIRLRNGPPPGTERERQRRGRRPRYGPQVLSILTAIWEAAGCPWSVRLKALLPRECGDGLRAKRDYAMLAMLLGCGLRRSERVGLEIGDVQTRQGHWDIVDLIGKGGHIRTVPIPLWPKPALGAKSACPPSQATPRLLPASS
jgi:integrase